MERVSRYNFDERFQVFGNVNNLFDKKYVGGLSAGAIYGAPRNAALTLAGCASDNTAVSHGRNTALDSTRVSANSTSARWP